MTETAAERPLTLCIDIGATSTKGCLVDADGLMVSSMAKRRTVYPFTPRNLVEKIEEIAERLESPDRVAVGFPGVVRSGRILAASNLARGGGPTTRPTPELLAAWHDFDLGGALEKSLGMPVVIANDADIAALGCSIGEGVELTVTLGSGVGTGLVVDGVLNAHLELSEIGLLGVESLDSLIGERARKVVTPGVWDRRVVAVLNHLDAIVRFDKLWITGGNARRLHRDRLGDLLERTTVTSEPVGLLGGVRLFDTL